MRASRYFIAVLGPIGLVVAACLVFLYRGGEFTPLAMIAAEQQRHGGLYGTAVHADTHPYKFALLRAREPDIAVIGSSRVLTFRQELFDARIVNMGLTASSVEQMEGAVRELLQTRKPRAVLLGVDHYWGNPAWERELNARNAPASSRVVPNIMLPVQWLLDRKISPRDFLTGLAGSIPSASGAAYAWGWSALRNGDGFAADGSYVYGATLYGRAPAADPQFRDLLARVTGGLAQFAYGDTVSEPAVAAYIRTIALLGDAGVRVAVLIPPVAPAVYREIAARRQTGYRYMQPFLDRIAKSGVQLGAAVFDMLDPAAFSGLPCEFVDGFHTGDVGAARILKAMGDALGADIINRARVEAVIAKRAGYASLDDRFARPGERETDFLGLGCAR